MADSPNGGSPSSLGSRDDNGDIFGGDDEAVGGLLKSLISAKGLQSAWQRIGKRLQVAEKGLKGALARLDTLPGDYVSRGEWTDLVLRKHKTDLEKHGTAIAQLEELTSNISETVLKEQTRLRDLAERTRSLEGWQESVNPVVHEVQERAQKLQDEVLSELKAAKEDISHHTAASNEELVRLRDVVQKRLDGMSHELEALEGRMRDFAVGEVKRATDELMKFEDPTESGPSPQQANMLSFVGTNLVDPVRGELQKAENRIQAIVADLAKQREDMTKQIRTAERLAVDVSTKMKQANTEMKEDLESRAKKADVAKSESALSSGIKEVAAETQSLHAKVCLKLNEFMDHFSKLHDAIDDHEHCLRHHAEEIENRGTKYDVLICQNQIDRCTRKDEFVRETQDMRKVMNWQSSKIESFGLITSGLSSARRRHGGSNKRLSRLSNARHGTGSRMLRGNSKGTVTSRASEYSTPVVEEGEDSMLRSQSAASMAESRISPPRSLRGSVSQTPQEKATELEAVVDGDEVELPSTQEGEQESRELLGAEDEAADDDEDADLYVDEDDDSEDDGMGSSSIFRQQLEAVAMGLVGLAHLLLREPKLGMARDARLKQEKEMLVELQNLRHWISNRIAPSGWDPAKITTVALSCSHPRPDELKRPLPQVSLKGIMAEEQRQRRFPSADPPRSARGGARAKMATSALIADHLAKAPLTARGHGMGGAPPTLPPLQGLTVAAA